MEGAIYSEILSYRRYPQDMIVVSDNMRDAVRGVLSGPGK